MSNHQKSSVTNARFRPNFHITPEYGWMNDPNGLVFFKGYYHVFYQNYPYKAEWGPMHWGHVRSKDLLHWENLPIALEPGGIEDTDGVFSGSAIVKDDKLWLMYTGHHYYDDNNPDHFWQNQNLAYSEDGVSFKKYKNNPVIAHEPQDSTQHFRDPKLWHYNNDYYVVIGNQSKSKLGRALIYKSQNLFEWEYLGNIDEARVASLEGDMWECPDFFRLDNQDILMFSPMHIDSQTYKFRNLYQTGYFMGIFDYKKIHYERSEFKELDSGHDFYAVQSFLSPDGRRVAIGWGDMWESNFNEKSDGWAGIMSLPRELSIKNNQIFMKPVREVSLLEMNLVQSSDAVDQNTNLNSSQILSGEFKIQMKTQSFTINFLDNKKDTIIKLDFDINTNRLALEHIDHPKDRRYCHIQSSDQLKLDIFIDKSIMEIFVQDGEGVFTERYYVDSPLNVYMSGNKKPIRFEAYDLELV